MGSSFAMVSQPVLRFIEPCGFSGYRDPMPIQVDAATMRRLALHEARVHAVPARDLRDLGDSILLHDPVDPEPFWNRIAGIRWPAEPGAFDRRLTEVLVLFASLGRQPHVWPSPRHDSPHDLIARLTANGFQEMGLSTVMAIDRGSVPAPGEPAAPAGVTLERSSGLRAAAAATLAPAIVEVLTDAFDVGVEREPGIRDETVVSLGHRSFTHYLVRLDGQPAAVARRATFDNVSYLSSIGTATWARGHGLGRLVTEVALRDALLARSKWTHLGVYSDNVAAIKLYRSLGFERIGDAVPDLLFV
jgi:ribosomal protein S18 acetylase RimI-like enzyme